LIGADGMTLVFVPAGEFTMGSDDSASGAFEGPAHMVDLEGFWIDQTEVSNEQFAACVRAGACSGPYSTASATRDAYYGNPDFGRYPVIHVDWLGASAYCKWAGRRLPSEAEWEKAARADASVLYPWGNAWDVQTIPRVNFSDKNDAGGASDTVADDGYGDTAPVASYPDGASRYGVYDMSGNVWEWVNDWFGAQYYSESPSANPPGPASGAGRVLRGGSWSSDTSNIRSANRVWLPADASGDDIGFRCARSQ